MKTKNGASVRDQAEFQLEKMTIRLKNRNLINLLSEK